MHVCVLCVRSGGRCWRLASLAAFVLDTCVCVYGAAKAVAIVWYRASMSPDYPLRIYVQEKERERETEPITNKTKVLGTREIQEMVTAVSAIYQLSTSLPLSCPQIDTRAGHLTLQCHACAVL